MRKFILISTIFALLLGAVIIAGEKEDESKKEKPAEKAKATKITWYEYDEGLALAKEQGKKVFVEFTTTWCGWCKKMHATTFKDPKIIELMDEGFIAVSVDAESRDSLNIDGWITTKRRLAAEFGVRSYPWYWFLDDKAERIAPVRGYQTSDNLKQILTYLKDDYYLTMDFQEYINSQKNKDGK